MQSLDSPGATARADDPYGASQDSGDRDTQIRGNPIWFDWDCYENTPATIDQELTLNIIF